MENIKQLEYCVEVATKLKDLGFDVHVSPMFLGKEKQICVHSKSRDTIYTCDNRDKDIDNVDYIFNILSSKYIKVKKVCIDLMARDVYLKKDNEFIKYKVDRIIKDGVVLCDQDEPFKVSPDDLWIKE
ncbi:MAG: hypothetical protein ACPG9K_00970 [Poseidonibacter sp.]